MKNYTAVLLVIIALFAGAIMSDTLRKGSESIDYVYSMPPLDGFSPVSTSIDGTTVSMFDDCYRVSFDITEDQAYSISRGFEGITGPRPLTHDIMTDIMENFGITVDHVRIDRYDDEIYKATIYMRQNGRALHLDARPSDSIALSTRLGTPIYFDTEILQRTGENRC